MIKPSLPKGTRDYTPEYLSKRDYIIQTLKKTFENYGFQPIETPAFEKTETLLGKYGEEGDKLIFKILNSGDFLKKVPEQILLEKDSKKLAAYISEKALRYDLTVPLARYTAMHRHEITFPFKRYQIQPVWRADRPQKGRFREFYQCDADVLGSKSLWQEVEFIQLYNDVFKQLKVPVTIRMNNRKILDDIIAKFNLQKQKKDLLVILDKLDKTGWDKVILLWQEAGIPQNQTEKLQEIFSLEGSIEEKISYLKEILGETEGLTEAEIILKRTGELDFANLDLDLSLARGLEYYTGTIYEIKANGVSMGSLGGGGRYDHLTDIFGVKDLSGIGISFGLDRIILVMNELNLFQNLKTVRPDILFVNFGDKEAAYAWKTVRKLRSLGISAELYPDAVKMKKQFQYADKRPIPYVAIAGENEIKAQVFSLKNMQEGTQQTVDEKQLIQILKS